MDSTDLKLYLINNVDIIISILESFGAHGIKITDNKRIQFGMPDNSGNRAHCIYLDEALLHSDYPNGIQEDFIKFVMRMIGGKEYSKGINFIKLYLNGGVIDYENDGERNVYEERQLTSYSKEVLDSFESCISELFINDGIPPTVQSIFGIRYSSSYNRVLIPIVQKGELVGLFGRYNQKQVEENVAKWFPILSYPKGHVLYPFDINSEYIRKSKKVYLVESEKTPLLAYKWGIRNILALGGNSIKSHQIDLLKELGVEKVCVCLDKSLGDGYIEYVSIRLKESGFDVCYVDVDSIPYLPNKESVFDLNNKELVLKTIKEYIKVV